MYLVMLTLPETMDTIGYEAFSGCTSLKQMDLPEGLTYLGEHAFKNCKALETLSLPNTLESIENVFYKCLALKTISVKPNHPTMSSEGGMLYDHNRTELIYAGGGVEGDITLPDTLTQIRESALDDCYYITGIVFPGGLNDIGPMTFTFCSAMEWIQVSDANQDYASHDGMLFEKDLANLVCCPAGRKSAMTLPDSVYHLEPYAFAMCSDVPSITIPEGVEILSALMFYRCDNLTDLTLPASIIHIDDETFDKCPNVRITAPADSYAYTWAEGKGLLKE